MDDPSKIPAGYERHYDVFGNFDGWVKSQSDQDFARYVPGTKMWGLPVTSSSLDGDQDGIAHSWMDSLIDGWRETARIAYGILVSAVAGAFVLGCLFVLFYVLTHHH